MPIANVNGQNLYYEDTGGTGAAIVFSHGLLMDHTMFEPQVSALKGKYRCITWDERGHGKTAVDTIQPFTYYDSANDLVALLKHLGIQQAVLAGMSQGGYLSLRCALTHPQIVRALILIDTQAMTEDASKTPGYKQMIDIWSQQGLPDEIATTMEHVILGQHWAGSAAWKAKWKAWNPANLLACFHTLVERDDIAGKIGSIQVSALVIHGDSDIAITLDRALAMSKALPNSEFVVIKGGGHASNLTHPQQVNPVIEKFLARLQ